MVDCWPRTVRDFRSTANLSQSATARVVRPSCVCDTSLPLKIVDPAACHVSRRARHTIALQVQAPAGVLRKAHVHVTHDAAHPTRLTAQARLLPPKSSIVLLPQQYCRLSSTASLGCPVGWGGTCGHAAGSSSGATAAHQTVSRHPGVKRQTPSHQSHTSHKAAGGLVLFSSTHTLSPFFSITTVDSMLISRAESLCQHKTRTQPQDPKTDPNREQKQTRKRQSRAAKPTCIPASCACGTPQRGRRPP